MATDSSSVEATRKAEPKKTEETHHEPQAKAPPRDAHGKSPAEERAAGSKQDDGPNERGERAQVSHDEDDDRDDRPVFLRALGEENKNGAQVRETSYKKDGARVNETITTQPDGTIRKEAVVEKNGKIEKTTSVTKESDKPIEELIGGENADKLRDSGISDGDRNKTQVTQVTREVIDTTKQPPEKKTVLESTSYKQHIPHEGDSDVPNLNREHSGQTLAYTVSQAPGADGKTHTTEELGSTKVLTGTDDGRRVTASETMAATKIDGKPVQVVTSKETDGIFNKDTLDMFHKIGDKDEYIHRLQGDTIPTRETEIVRFDKDGKAQDAEKIQEYGNFNNLDGDGVTVSITEKDDKTFWSHRKVSEDGHHIQEQVNVEGTEGRILSDTRKNDDGTFLKTVDVYDGDNVKIVHNKTERRLADPAEIKGDPKYRQEFLDAAGGKPIYIDKTINVDTSDLDKVKSSNVSSYSIDGSDERLTTVFYQDGGPFHKTSIMEDGNSQTPAKMKNEDDGSEFSIDKDNKVSVNGEVLNIGATGTDPLASGKSSLSALDNLYSSLKTAKNLPDLPSRLGGPLAGIGVVSDSIGLYSAIRDGKVVEAIGAGGSTASSLGGASALASEVVSSSKLTTALGVGGKVLGGVGAVVGLGYGGYQISQGKIVEGSLDLAAAGGASAVLLGTAIGSSVIPVAGWIVAGGAIITKVGYDIWHGNKEKHKTADLEF